MAWAAKRRHTIELASWLRVGGNLRMVCEPDATHTIRFVGPGFRDVLGYEPDEIVGQPWASFVHPDDMELARQFLDLDQGQCDGDPMTLTVRWRHKNLLPGGEVRWVWLEWIATYVPELNLCYTNARDLTSRFERESSVAVWSRITSDLMAVGNMAIPIEERKFEWVNEAWTRQLGWSLAELYALRIMDLVEPSDAPEVIDQWEEIERGAWGPSTIECRIRCKTPGGEQPRYRYFQWNAVEMGGRMYVTGHDVGAERDHRTEMAQAIRDLEARNADLERFASVAAHQLRSPPRTIAGIAVALQEDYSDRLDEEGRQFLEDIRLDADQMAEIVDGLYRFSKVRTSAEMNIEPVDLNEVLHNLKLPRAKKRCGDCVNGHTCPNAVKPPFDCPRKTESILYENLPVVLGDRTLLREVFSNLVDNGLKFNEADEKLVRVSAERRPDGRWTITVKDNGIGISEKYHSKLFQMFERVHPTYTGTGVGLALVSAIVNKLGGSISVTSSEGEGAVFTFDLEGAWIG